MSNEVHVGFATYAEAQKLIPVFEWYVKNSDIKEVKRDAGYILDELKRVRNIDYSPGRRGAQLFFRNEGQVDLFYKVKDEVIG